MELSSTQGEAPPCGTQRCGGVTIAALLGSSGNSGAMPAASLGTDNRDSLFPGDEASRPG